MDENEKYLKSELAKLTQENFFLRERLAEMEEFCQEAQKALELRQKDQKLFKEAERQVEYLESELDRVEKDCGYVKSENFRLVEENRGIRESNSQLNAHRKVLEIELERMSQVLNGKNEQIWRMIEDGKCVEGNITGFMNKGEVPRVNKEKRLNRTEKVFRDPEMRDRVFEFQKNKMKTLASQSISSKGTGVSFRFSSPTRYTKCSSIGELKTLIKQAQEMQMSFLKPTKLN